MGLLENLQKKKERTLAVQNVKLQILNRMTMEQLATLYDNYVDTGSSGTKEKFVTPGSIADLVISATQGRENRASIVKKLSTALTLDLIKIKAAEFKINISDIKMV